MEKKIDISSTVLEKGIDLAKGFIDRLINPSVEELGLLMKDQISYWRFRNQILILNKAKELCDRNKINIKSISPKLLCPYLENASLEDDDELQEKWASLLVNMVDSNKNIQNHVFPYILSQLSKGEFTFLESVVLERRLRISTLKMELAEYLEEKKAIDEGLLRRRELLKTEMEQVSASTGFGYTSERGKLLVEIGKINNELKSIKFKEVLIRRSLTSPEKIPDGKLEEFEISNIIRLGLAATEYEASAETQSIEIPSEPHSTHVSVNFDIDLDTRKSVVLTELGELFIDACTK